MNQLQSGEVFGFIKTNVDVHTLGLMTIANLVKDCGYKSIISPKDISTAVTDIKKLNNISKIQRWIFDNGITRLGFSYRLDPKEGKDYFSNLYYRLREMSMFYDKGGPLREVFFAGLPDACELVKRELGYDFLVFPGDEDPIKSLIMLGIPESQLPVNMNDSDIYDDMRWKFAEKLIEQETYKLLTYPDHYGYPECGTQKDSFIKRLNYCKTKQSLPIIRAHVGPYNPDRIEALREFKSWVKDLSNSKLLDVLSIGSSQLTQSNFGEDWYDKPNGGGVPINSEAEYIDIKETASPMLVRTYAGTKNIPFLAKIHERTLNISWHALSFWWFCEIDGRGENTVLENLKEHIETIRYIASTDKPLEPNVSHHFAFRGSDDITFVISGYLAAKTAKKYGIRHLIVQNMLNTPKYTTGLKDLAKGRVMLRLIRELEDENFHISLQARAGLDYFSPNLEKAKVQLASVTALMDDIEPENPNSPEIIHVVSYSEAVRLATPTIIKESIQITLTALKEYRKARKLGKVDNLSYNKKLDELTGNIYREAKESILILEKYISNLYSPEGLFRVFEEGFFPVPYLLNSSYKYDKATDYMTAIKEGGISVVDDQGNIINTVDRYNSIIEKYS